MTIVRPEGVCQCKIPMIPPGIEPTTFRIVVQCLNHLRHRLSPQITELNSRPDHVGICVGRKRHYDRSPPPHRVLRFSSVGIIPHMFHTHSVPPLTPCTLSKWQCRRVKLFFKKLVSSHEQLSLIQVLTRGATLALLLGHHYADWRHFHSFLWLYRTNNKIPF